MGEVHTVYGRVFTNIPLCSPQDVCLNLITIPSCAHQNLLWTLLEILWDAIPLHLRIVHLDVFSSKQLCVHVEEKSYFYYAHLNDSLNVLFLILRIELRLCSA